MPSDFNEDRAYEMGDPTRTRYLQPDEEEPECEHPPSQRVTYIKGTDVCYLCGALVVCNCEPGRAND